MTGRSIFRYGLGIGADLLRAAELSLALPYLVRPVNYWRAAEYRAVLEEAAFCAADRVLDVGSPKLLGLHLAERTGAEVHLTDLNDYFVRPLSRIAAVRGIPPSRLHLGVEDGRRLGFPDGSFTKVYSISVLEHIPGDGDGDCARELGRVLAEGGRCVLTTPFAARTTTEYRRGGFYWAPSGRADGRVFYQRRYDEEDLFRRLIEPSGLRLRRLAYIGERVGAGRRREVSQFLPALTGPIQPALSRLLLTRPTASWRDLAKPLCAVIVLDRPPASPTCAAR